MIGIFESVFNPCAYGIISDYFHPSSRTTANSIYNLGVYLGGALSSITIILITSLGWRTTYDVIGIGGIGIGIVTLVFVIEPKRGKFDPPKEKVVQ
jgi:MFS family permease